MYTRNLTICIDQSCLFFLSFEQSIKFCLDCRSINLRNVTDGECVFQLSIYKWTQNSKGSHVQVRTYVMIKRFERKWKYSKVVLIFFRKSMQTEIFHQARTGPYWITTKLNSNFTASWTIYGELKKIYISKERRLI